MLSGGVALFCTYIVVLFLVPLDTVSLMIVFQVFISYTGGQSVSHVLLWQPSECVYLIVNCVISFSENKYDDYDEVWSRVSEYQSYLAIMPPSIIHPSVYRPHSPSQTASGPSQPFCHSTLSRQTNTQTDSAIGDRSVRSPCTLAILI